MSNYYANPSPKSSLTTKLMQYFGTPGKPMTFMEFYGYWRSLSEAEKDDNRNFALGLR